MVSESTKPPVLLDARGRPFEAADRTPRNGKAPHADPELRSLFLGSIDLGSYFRGLASTELPALQRATEPLANHPWIFAAVVCQAVVASMAEFQIFIETEDEQERRRLKARRLGRPWRGGAYGNRRRATARRRRIQDRVQLRGLEHDPDHPLTDVLFRPNPFQDGSQLWQMTHMWIALRGEAFWVKSMADGSEVPPNSVPDRLWPMSPESMSPILANVTWGELVGWELRLPHWSSMGPPGSKLRLDTSQVVHFKSANLSDPLRGFSPLTPAASTIKRDMLVDLHTNSLLQNDATPRGVLSTDQPLDRTQLTEIAEQWSQKYEGPHRSGRTAILGNGFKFQPLTIPYDSLGIKDLRDAGRREILAVEGTPPSVVGLTEVLNYATALAQDRSYWEKRIIPLHRMEEATVDNSLFGGFPDTTIGLFDASDVDALRVGIRDKVEVARQAAGSELHMPPRIAYEVAGLEVEDYEGDDVALVPGLSTPVSDILGGGVGPVFPDPPQVQDPDAEPEDGSGLPDEGEQPAQAASGAPHARQGRRGAARSSAAQARKWAAFVRLEARLERATRGAYTEWVLDERRRALRALSEADQRRRQVFGRAITDLTQVVPELVELALRLRRRTRPIQAAQLEAAWTFTLPEIGVPTFDIDDPLIVRIFDVFERRLVDTTAGTLSGNIRSTLEEGIRLGEDLPALRVRLGRIFDISASAPKTLAVARTGTASFMNGVRDAMFERAGVTEESWINAGDENVRHDHEAFERAGPQPRGTNYLALGLDLVNGSDGVLEFPGDPRAPAGQVINCRCLKEPIG